MANNNGNTRMAVLVVPVFVFAVIFSACGAGTTTTPGGVTDTTHTIPPVDTTGTTDTTGATTPVGTATGTAVTKSVGPAGGTLISGDGRLTVTIPANALAGTVNISVQPISNQGPGGVGVGYRLLPDGQTFATPIQLTFQHTDTELEGSIPDLLGVAYQEAAGYWDELPGGTYNAAAKTLTVSTTHFTDYILVVSIKLVPARASIKVGTSLGLTAVDCSYLAGTKRRLRNCRVGLFTVNSWAVNGAPGGTTGSGTVTGSTLTGIYKAPSSPPSPNSVAVSANMVGGLRDGTQSTVTLVSNVVVTGDSWLAVTVTTGVFGSVANFTWELLSSENGVSTYKPVGSVTATIRGCTVSPATHTLNSQTDGRLYVDYNTTPATFHGNGTSVWTATVLCDGGPPLPNATAFYFGGGTSGALGNEVTGTVLGAGAALQISGDVTRSGTRFQFEFTRVP